MPEAIPIDGASQIADMHAILNELHGVEIRNVTDPSDPAQAAVAIVPHGKELRDLSTLFDSRRTQPRHREGNVTVQTLPSLIDITNRFKDSGSAAFAFRSLTAPRIVVVFDYHPAGEAVANTQRRCKHRAQYTAPLSDEWQIWLRSNGQKMSQADFAAFLEERIQDVVAIRGDDQGMNDLAEVLGTQWMNPSMLMAFSRGLSVNVETKVREAVTLSTGEVSVVYEDQHRDGAGAPFKIPTLFVVGIPIFLGADLYRLPVRLRYRVNAGQITWSYHMYRPERAFDDAFMSQVAKLASETGVPAYYGTPE